MVTTTANSAQTQVQGVMVLQFHFSIQFTLMHFELSEWGLALVYMLAIHSPGHR